MEICSIISKFLGISEADKLLKDLFFKRLIITTFNFFLMNFSFMFLVLYVTDYVSFPQFSFLLVLQVIIIILTDYPTGVLGDIIGHHWVLFIGFSLLSLSYIIFSIARSFEVFLFGYFIFSLGLSQESGALTSWFENEYKHFGKNFDSDRKIYSFYLSRLDALTMVTSIPALILGGIAASILSRSLVIYLQGLGYFLLAVISLILMKSHSDWNLSSGKKTNSPNNSFTRVFSNGIRFMFSSKFLFLFFLSEMLLSASRMIWRSFIVFFILFGFSGTDSITGVVRSIIFGFNIVLQIITANISNYMNSYTWLVVLNALWGLTFFGGYFILLSVFPLNNSFQITALLIIILVIYPISNILSILDQLLRQRITSLVIPSEIRNSVYSLIPTGSSIIFGGLILVIGFIAEFYDFSMILLVLIIVVEFSAFLLVTLIKKMSHLESDSDSVSESDSLVLKN